MREVIVGQIRKWKKPPVPDVSTDTFQIIRIEDGKVYYKYCIACTFSICAREYEGVFKDSVLAYYNTTIIKRLLEEDYKV